MTSALEAYINYHGGGCPALPKQTIVLLKGQLWDDLGPAMFVVILLISIL